MNTKWFRIVLITALVYALVLPFASPAIAKAPEKYSGEYDWIDHPLFDCGDFWITENSHVTYNGTVFYDNGGNVTREQVQVTYNGTFTNSVTRKSVIDAPDHQTQVYYPDGSTTVHGLVMSINIPGAGTIGLDAGTLSFDPLGNITFASGPHHLVGDGFETDFNSVCEALR